MAHTLPQTGLILEIASGTGQHALAAANRFKRLTWQPSDPDPAARASIEAWRAELVAGNMSKPLAIDVTTPNWWKTLEQPLNAIVCINMLHISPWQAGKGLISGAAKCIKPGGVLFLYGPFKVDGKHTAPSNAEFDTWLKNQNDTWGVRDIGDIEELAKTHGFQLTSKSPMPANNFTLVFSREA